MRDMRGTGERPQMQLHHRLYEAITILAVLSVSFSPSIFRMEFSFVVARQVDIFIELPLRSIIIADLNDF